MERAWKEVYRVVKEAELYLKRCSGEKWWVKSITLSTTGEAYAIHVHDLAWSVLCLHLNLLYSQGQTDESYTAAAYTAMGDFHAEMCNSMRIHDETEDKIRLVTIFQELLKDCEEKSVSDEDKSKLGVARFMSRKLQATIGNEPAVNCNRVAPWLQIDSKDLIPKLRVIGEGTFGKVYEGSWLGVKVAVKEICWFGEDIDSSLLEEIDVHAKLQSPFIAQLIGVCLLERCCYLVMEFVSFSLDRILKYRLEGDRPPLPLPVVVDTMLQISRAMEYLHSRKIMHMDLKASNVLIQPSEVPEFRAYGYGQVKLCDFGESRLRLYSFRSAEFSRGTCYWRSPEVFQYPQEGFEEDLGISKRYTQKADVYSFAMTCYEILTGKLPYEGVDERNVYGLVVQGKRPSLPPWCPSVLGDYIKTCWDTNPDCRPNFTHVSYFLRYMKFLLMRVNNSGHWDSLNAICKKIDVAKFVMLDGEGEQGSDESTVNFNEEGLIIRALDGNFPDSFQPYPVSQQSAQPLSPKDKIFVSLPDYIQQYSYKEMQNATDDFSRNVSGVSGLMWKGVLSDGTHVTVKKQRLEISMKEISMLWQLHHPNAVRLRGVSAGVETFLVYDHMVLGSLAGQLFRPTSILDWNIRKKIGIAIARFLSYLHDNNGKKFLNIHLKCTEILLDERFTPKFCGFLSVNLIDMNSRLLSSSEQQNLHLALQYEKFRNIQDFGIILLELLLGCKWESIRESLQSITNSMETQGWEYISRLLDEKLQGQVGEEEAMKWVKLALSCFARSPLEKLPMNKAVLVMKGLEQFPELPSSRSLRDLTPSQILYITSAKLEQDTGMTEMRVAWTMVNNGIQRSVRNTSSSKREQKGLF
ncbi:uncharacterized protein LOC131055196 [Cryptomeria japonica]|uniref:uncharacterized protein LOC131055196 n=1 Tax=Cryptomeria japonica TaxID=3369 RepID=UPI0027DA4B4F|nr:uncharacterized protein LOC131055196 [Cryptomeria japonica]